MKVFALRLEPNRDLKVSLQDFAIENHLQAGFVLTAIGSLKQGLIRFANRDTATILPEKLEILSLNGTLSESGIHLHIAVADGTGKTRGGHLVEGCVIYTTAEIVIGEAEGLTFLRTVDRQTGFRELQIVPTEDLA
jgi:predicted DNA-binding protein with PD1-like motif